MARPFDARFPALARQLPRVTLGDWPTPLESAAPALAAAVGLPLLLKRDDRAGTAYGGSKVRKLEYLLGAARAAGADAVVTFGAAGSNHALATAIYAHQQGLVCHAVLTPQVPTPAVADALRHHLRLGTRLHPATGFADSRAVASSLRQQHPGGPEKLYEIPWGGSSWLGAVGFVAAGFELVDQCGVAGLSPPSRIYLPCGTMGAAVGLALGLRAAGARTVVHAVKVVPQNAVNASALAELFHTVNRELHTLDPGFPLLGNPLEGLVLRTGFLGPGYAQPGPDTLAAMELAQSDGGLKLDATYSGKAFACLLKDARTTRERSAEWLFWLTYNSKPLPEIGGIRLDELPEALRASLASASLPPL